MKLTAKYGDGPPTKEPKIKVTYAEKKQLDNMPVEERTEATREKINYTPGKYGNNPKGEAAILAEADYKQHVEKANRPVVIDVAKRNKQEKAGKLVDAPLIRNSDKAEERATQKSLATASIETDANRPKIGWERQADVSEKNQIKFKEENEQDKVNKPILVGGFKKASMGMR